MNTLMLYVLALAIGQSTSIAYLFFDDYAPWLLERIPLWGVAGLFLLIVCSSWWLLHKEGLWKWAGVLISPASIPLGQIIWVDLLTRFFSPATVEATHHWQPFIYPAIFTAVTMYLVYYRPKKETENQRS